MLFPLPLYPFQEYAAALEAGYICPVCRAGRLEAEEPENPESEKLVCSSCSGVFRNGWRRHYWSKTPPTNLYGTPVERLGGFYETIQSYKTQPSLPQNDAEKLSSAIADFVIDIDREALWEAQRDAKAVYDYLDAFAPGQVRVYYSGSKGFHIIVPFQTIGAKPSSTLVEREYKQLAVLVARKTGVMPDYKIYSPSRMLRVRDSWHPKTGRYKVELNPEEIDEAEMYSVAPRGVINTTPPRYSEEMHELYLMAEEAAREQDEYTYTPRMDRAMFTQGGFASGEPPCIETLLEEGLPYEGTRHSVYFMMARYWLSSGLPLEVRGGYTGHTLVDGALLRGRQYAAQTDDNTKTPQSQRIKDMEQVVRHVYANDVKFTCAGPRSIGICDPRCPIRQLEDHPTMQLMKFHQPFK